MSIIEELSSLIPCGADYDCETLKKLLLVDQECALDMTVCEALKQAIKQDAGGNIFLDIPTRLRLPEISFTGENPVVLEDTVWGDQLTPVSSIRLGGAQPPTNIAYKGSFVLAFPSNADKTIYFVTQMPHEWKEGSDISFHIHWTIPTSGAGAGAENVKWDLTYSIANGGDLIPAESTATVTVDVQNVALDIHLDTTIADIDMSAQLMSCVILCSLTRDVGVANDYADDAYLLFIDFHYEIDSLGSKEENVK